MFHNYTKKQKGVWVLFILYLVALIYLVFFAETFRRGERLSMEYAYNLELFKEIRRFYRYRKQLGMDVMLVNLAGNVLAFMPFAFMLPVVSPKARGFFKTVFLTFLLSLSIECVQLAARVGSFDVDDLLLNTIGGILGFIAYRIVQKIRVRRKLRAGRKKEA